MPAIWITEFTGGLDVRKLPETSKGGTLIRAVDCHINRGGEIEQRADFELVYTSPLNATVGLAATRATKIVFGHIASAPAGLPSGFSYQRLQHPTGEALVRIVHWSLYAGKVYAIGEFADGSRYEFYDGARVTDVNAPSNKAGAEPPTATFTFGTKLFVTAGPVLFNSAIGDASDFTATGTAFKDLSTYVEGADLLTAMARYENRLAVFAEESIQTWFIDADPAQDSQTQTLSGTGAVAPRAVLPFRDGDLIYVDRTGIRSLRARDSSNSAATNDLGSPIDPLVIDALETLPAERIARICCVIEPRDGRCWVAIGSTIYVFSYFEGSKISAWTQYQPGFEVDDMVVSDRRVWLRSGDDIYVYGAQTGPYQYSADVQAEAWLPYLDAEAPARGKQISGADAAVRGTWRVALGFDPENLDAEDEIARISGSTFRLGRMSAAGAGAHVSMRFRCLGPLSPTKPAILSSGMLHFERHQDEDTGEP